MGDTDDNLIHVEVSRSWWNGTSTTACGKTLHNVSTVWTWFTNRTWCPVCKQADKAARR